LSESSPTDLRELDGIIPVNKAWGWTSHDVVARVRRLTHQRHTGHAGTLDPAATGVLPVCLGQATRVVEYLSDSGKAYRATIRFGVTTDTYDATGTILTERPLPALLDDRVIAAALPEFIGDIMQVPPMYSALKRDGKRLYELARQGIEVERPARPVHIASLSIVDWNAPYLVLDIECGKGTYIRSLAYNLGEHLGVGAHLAELKRTRVGPFLLKQCVTLDEFEVSIARGDWQQYVYAPDEALLGLRAAIVGPRDQQRIRQGLMLRFSANTDAYIKDTSDEPADSLSPKLLRAYSSSDGSFLGILERKDAITWHPAKVFSR
jgi:tRNA pseudouridine55 synthase